MSETPPGVDQARTFVKSTVGAMGIENQECSEGIASSALVRGARRLNSNSIPNRGSTQGATLRLALPRGRGFALLQTSPVGVTSEGCPGSRQAGLAPSQWPQEAVLLQHTAQGTLRLALDDAVSIRRHPATWHTKKAVYQAMLRSSIFFCQAVVLGDPGAQRDRRRGKPRDLGSTPGQLGNLYC